jgi:hypothetical protein
MYNYNHTISHSISMNLTKKVNRIFTRLTIFLFSILLVSNLFAQVEKPAVIKKFNQAVNTCPGGIPMGIYSVNYEYFFGKNIGLMARFDYEDIPKKYTDANIEASGVAFILNSRWHFSGEMESKYVGVYLRYRKYSGSGNIESTDFDFTIPEMTLGVNYGKRWIWDNGFNINLAFGYGFFLTKTHDADPSNASIKSVLDQFEDSYDFIDPFLGEFSIGYTF